MSLLSSHVSPEGLMGPLRCPRTPQAGAPQSTAGRVADPSSAFKTELLQQMLSTLEQTSLSIHEAEAPTRLLSTSWARCMAATTQAPSRGHAVLQPGIPPPTHPKPFPLGPRDASLDLVRTTPPTVPKAEPEASPTLPAKAQPPSASPADGFLGKLAGVAKATAEGLGLSPHLLLAQAALETGWGRKAIKDGAGQESFNLFGIKAGKQWKGKTVEVMTTEYIHGQAHQKVETFRAYASYAESFSDYAKLIKGRYGDAIAQGATAEGFGQALQAKGYATDPNYAQKIARVAQSVAYRLASSQGRNRDLV